MSVLIPALLSVLILLAPWVLMPRAARGPRPEVRGLLRLLWWVNRGYGHALHQLRTEDAPLPPHGPAMLIANHTCGIDHMLLQAGCRRVLGFMIAQEFYDFWACRPFCLLLGCIPVRRDGRDLAAARAALRALKGGRVVPIFPEGRITPKSGREVGAGKPGAAFLALSSGAPVVPAYIRGTPPTNDVFRALLWPSRARVAYGPPVDLSDLRNGRAPDKAALAAATGRLMGAILALKARVEREEGIEPAAPEPARTEPLAAGA